ncbi:MAG TPA: ion channel [Patescibacteria group bacterium]|nr:ion channel [Patescibacteria group bacterium]
MFVHTPKHKFTKRLLQHRPFRNALILLVTLSFFLGVIVVSIESRSPDANIHTIEEGLWWAITTVTGVGYGDYVPVTTIGRTIGATLEIAGVVVFGLLVGIIGITMTKKQEEYNWFRLFERLDQLEGRIRTVERSSTAIVKSSLSEDDEVRPKK